MRFAAVKMGWTGIMLAGWILAAYAGGPGAAGPNVVMPDNPNQLGASPWQYSAFKNLRLKELSEKVRDADNGDKDNARKQTQELVTALSLPCEPTDAAHAGAGKTKVDGKTRDLNVYEVACAEGTGYFLVSQPPQKPLAISCFAAEAMRAADTAQGDKSESDFHCLLPANKDVTTMAAAILRRVGTTCDVRNFGWLGVSAPRQMEYSEVRCADGQGYVLKVPQSGATTAQISAEGCQEAVSEGVKCKMTAVTMPVTLQTFRDAIKEHAVNCEPAQLRYIGRESTGRRYVVELQCPQQPHGLVAFIPLQGNTKPFETLDCPAAVARAVQCQLTAKQ